MTPRALKLDFCRTRPAPRWTAPLLLAIAMVFAGDAAFSFLSTLSHVKEKEQQLAKAEPRTYSPGRAASPEEVAAARDTVQRLSTPWDSLFSALSRRPTTRSRCSPSAVRRRHGDHLKTL
jgi:hypothetical protein